MTERKSKSQLINFVIDQDLLKQIDDFRYDHRIPTRAAAIKELIRRGLACTGHDSAAPTAEPPVG